MKKFLDESGTTSDTRMDNHYMHVHARTCTYMLYVRMSGVRPKHHDMQEFKAADPKKSDNQLAARHGAKR